MSTNDDELLMSDLKRGSHDAFTRLYDQYWERMYVIAYNRLKSIEDAEDAVQQVFTNVWRSRQNLKITKSLDAYMACAVRYIVYNTIRTRSYKTSQNYLSEFKLPSANHSTEDQLSFNELYEKLQEHITVLPAKCQLVFTLSRIHGHSNKEIGELLQISISTVENHINKALKMLRISLGDFLLFTICMTLLK